jgi:hypothetical protein
MWFAVRKSRSGRFSRHNFVNAALLLVALMVAVAPWTIRNAVTHKAFIPLGNEAAFNLWFTVGGVSVNEAKEQWDSWGPQAERQKEGLRRWREYVMEHPAHHLKRLVRHLPLVFDPEYRGFARGLALHHKGVASRKNIIMEKIINVMIPLMLAIVMGGGLAGLAIARDNPRRKTLFLITVLYFIVAHTATVMKARYFLPIVCLLSIYAARFIIVAIRRKR